MTEADELDWLPDLLELNDFGGDWQELLDKAYEYFARDFITNEPELRGVTVKSKRRVAYDGKDHSFWHCIEEHLPGEAIDEENRIPKIPLVERIRWPRPVIEHVAKSPAVLAWTEVYRGHGTTQRAHLFIPDEDYVVVLDPRGKDDAGKPRYYFLWTTFLCNSARQHQTMLKRYKRGNKIE